MKQRKKVKHTPDSTSDLFLGLKFYFLKLNFTERVSYQNTWDIAAYIVSLGLNQPENNNIS